MLTKTYSIKLHFPIWLFLKQPLFDKTTVFNPFEFWHDYKIQLLERCWHNDSVQILENCWNQNLSDVR
ncbi:hypothetical protein NIES2098_48720 [Calothrix sp. NIES-2098]|nr:hypothetical protein NIES2098_48720 [Calothrix sp. NIES-2098]